MIILRMTERGKVLRVSDFPACSGGDMLIINRRARDKIGSQLEKYGELLPLSCEDGDFWALNVTCLIDALDEYKSKILRSSDTKEMLTIQKHVFRPAVLRGAVLFKLPQMVRGLIYVTNHFVELIMSSGLVGLEFVVLWKDT